VIELPAALAPWAAELSLLSPDLALVLAPWVGRLAVALGPMSGVRTPGAGEPDGYGGLTRRGSYERLVTAEWALAELYPDEFVRRASAGEHLFLDLARRVPRGSRRAVAIVSAGPSQLGAPRLAHLAALVVLARRAATAGASFAWGLLEDPALRLGDGLDAAGIRRLLDGRTARAAGEPARRAWLAALGATPTDAVDAWWLGGPELADARGSRLIVRDVIEPGARAVDIEVLRPSGTARLRLALPGAGDCARLLRDPLARGAGSRVAAQATGMHDLRFVARGVKLALVSSTRPIVTWPVPNSPRAPLGNPRTWNVDGTTLAVGWRGKSLLRVSAEAGNVPLLRISEGNTDSPLAVILPEDDAAALTARLGHGARPSIGACGVVKFRTHQADLVIELSGGRMHMVTGYPPAPTSSRAPVAVPFVVGHPEARVLRALLRDRDVLWAQSGGGEVEIIRLTEAGTAVVARVASDEATPAVYVGRHARQSTSWGPLAVHRGGNHWVIVRSGEPALAVEADAPVVGLVAAPGGAPALLTQPDPHRLAIGVGGQRVELPTTPAGIAHVATSVYEPRIAWRTRAGELVVYSLAHRAVLMRLVPDTASVAVTGDAG
jgi:hypothetical protein